MVAEEPWTAGHDFGGESPRCSFALADRIAAAILVLRHKPFEIGTQAAPLSQRGLNDRSRPILSVVTIDNADDMWDAEPRGAFVGATELRIVGEVDQRL